MTKFTLSLIAGTAALALAAPALAQDRAPQADQTRAAVQERAQKAFERMDANKDGRIDTADREAHRKAMFDRVDADHNGQISYAEFSAKRERPAGDQARAGNRGRAEGRKMAWGGGKRGPGMHRGMRGSGMGKAADANSDGTITLAEFQAAALARFDMVDVNHDGTVTAAERKAQRDAMRQQWQQRREQRAG